MPNRILRAFVVYALAVGLLSNTGYGWNPKKTVDKVSNSVKKRVDKASNSVEERVDKASNSVEKRVEKAVGSVERTKEEIEQKVNELNQKLDAQIQKAKDEIEEKIKKLEHSINKRADKIGKSLSTSLKKLEEYGDRTIKTAEDIVSLAKDIVGIAKVLISSSKEENQYYEESQDEVDYAEEANWAMEPSIIPQKTSYVPQDRLGYNIKNDKNAYYYVIREDPEGKMCVMNPSFYNKGNSLSAGQQLTINDMPLGNKIGNCNLIFIAAENRIPELETYDETNPYNADMFNITDGLNVVLERANNKEGIGIAEASFAVYK